MNTLAVVMQRPEHLGLECVNLLPPADEDVVVDVVWSGISTGTERLLWQGRMPSFPGMGYPLVPGYEAVGVVASAGSASGRSVGEHVFVPGARCFRDVRGLFGGAAARLIVPGSRAMPIDPALGERGVLLALAATAFHALSTPGARPPGLIVGHGVLGRLFARLALIGGAPAPVVWERSAERTGGAAGYSVIAPDSDSCRGYECIYDASGDSTLLDNLIARLAHQGELVLAGFYNAPLAFTFPPAFMREARIRVAAEWQPTDLSAVKALVETGRLSLDGLISHRHEATEATAAYETAFTDPACLKMVLDWRRTS